MRIRIMISICIVLTCSFGAISIGQENQQAELIYSATIPDGTVVELIGLRRYSVRGAGVDYRWWRPDGSTLTEAPEIRGDIASSILPVYYLFVIRIKESEDHNYKAIGLWDSDSLVQNVRQKGQGYQEDELRQFILGLPPDAQEGAFRIGVALGEWKIVENWPLFQFSTPYTHHFDSREPVIVRCPEQVGPDVLAEITMASRDDATRLVAFDRENNDYQSVIKKGGVGAGLTRYICRFEDLEMKDIERLKFQKRPYDYWITFDNVSLQPGHQTQVQINIEKTGSLVGKPLPEFENIQTDFSPTSEKQKTILVCFFDMNQRSSRYSITELAKKAETMAQKNITVVAVQASPVENQALKEWITENNIHFPVGIIEMDEEKVKSNWGLKALPWLILTDKEHIVQAEGFGVDEVEEKIKTYNVFK